RAEGRERLESPARRRAGDDFTRRIDEIDAERAAAGAALREHRVHDRQAELDLDYANAGRVVADHRRELDDRPLCGGIGRRLAGCRSGVPGRLPPAFVALYEIR